MGLIFLRFFKFICEKSCPRLDIGREELDKYLNGRIKAHDHYFTEISPAIPKEYADCFKVNGCLLPGYTIEGEEPAKAAALPTQEEAAQPQQTTATPERREPVNEVFSMDATILMVTHDAFSASYANRILFLRDGEIYKEIMKGSSSRKEFFEQILEVLNTLGGGVNDVR